MDIFRNVRDTFAEISVVLDNLRRLHREKTNLRTVTEMFKTTTSSESYVNKGSQELIYSSRTNSMIYTNINEWIHHSIEKKNHQEQEGEPLLNSSNITKDDYIKALEIFATNNKKETTR